MLKTIAAVACGLLVCATGTASAQGFVWENKIFVNVSGGGTTGATDVRQQFTFEYFLEPATVDTTRRVGGGGLFDFTAGAMVVDNWLAGISFTKAGGDSSASFTGGIPDPAETDQFRPVSGSIPDMKHSESWFAFLAGYLLPKFPLPDFIPDFADKIDLIVLAGPVRAGVKHEVVSAVTVSETGSTPTVSIDRRTISKGFWGIQVGIDGRYMFTDHVGAGVFLRFMDASGDVVDGLNLDLGGFQFGGGVRIKF
jgi:hypothetical protein